MVDSVSSTALWAQWYQSQQAGSASSASSSSSAGSTGTVGSGFDFDAWQSAQSAAAGSAPTGPTGSAAPGSLQLPTEMFLALQTGASDGGTATPTPSSSDLDDAGDTSGAAQTTSTDQSQADLSTQMQSILASIQNELATTIV